MKLLRAETEMAQKIGQCPRPNVRKSQHPVARLLDGNDRDRYVRRPEHYRSLVEPSLGV